MTGNRIILGDTGDQNLHHVPTEWLINRMVPWMFAEADGGDWWVCVLTRDGKYLTATHDGGSTVPTDDRCKFARDVCRHLNKHVNQGGAWQCAWIDQARFYMLWRDKDGDIQIPIEMDLGFDRVKEWGLETWETHAAAAWEQWAEFHKNIDASASQQVCLATRH